MQSHGFTVLPFHSIAVSLHGGCYYALNRQALAIRYCYKLAGLVRGDGLFVLQRYGYNVQPYNGKAEIRVDIFEELRYRSKGVQIRCVL